MAPNLPRARAYLAKHGVRAILASSPINVAYLTGFDCWLYQKYTENVLVLGAPRARKEAFALLASEGEPVLVVDSYTSLFASELEGIGLQCYGAEPGKWSNREKDLDFTAYFLDALEHQKKSPVEALVSALRACGVTSGKVAIEPESMRPETLAALQKALPRVRFLDGTLLISLIRMVKTESETALLRRAALINEKGLYHSLGKAKTGARVGELASAYMRAVAKEGALFDHYFYSPDGLWLSGAMGYTLRRGEYTIIDSGCTYGQYYGDMGTTLLVSEPTRSVVEKYSTIWNTISELGDSVQPGDKPSELMQRFSALYRKVGIADTDHQGHGIGLEPREYPIMGQNAPAVIKDQLMETTTEIPLEVGMVISLETSIYEFGAGSYEVERTFRVGKRSLEELMTKKDRKIFVSD